MFTEYVFKAWLESIFLIHSALLTMEEIRKSIFKEKDDCILLFLNQLKFASSFKSSALSHNIIQI